MTNGSSWPHPHLLPIVQASRDLQSELRGADAGALDPEIAKGLEGSVAAALDKLEHGAQQTGNGINGWRVPPMTLGNYGCDSNSPSREGFSVLCAFAAVGSAARVPLQLPAK